MDDEALIEQLVSAYRERRADGTIEFAAAFYDLSSEARADAFALLHAQRALEAAQDPEGLSTTSRAVLARIRG